MCDDPGPGGSGPPDGGDSRAPGPTKSETCWSGVLAKAKPAAAPPASTGVFVGDSTLKAILKVHVGAKACPKSVTRSSLLEAAVRLQLLAAEDALVVAPRKGTGGAKYWHQAVEAAVARDMPLSADPELFYTDSELTDALEAQVGGGQVAPERISRADLLKQAVATGLVTQQQADVPAPTLLSEQELKRRWTGHVQGLPQTSGKKKGLAMPCGRKALTKTLLALGLLTKGEAEARVKRPDRAAAAATSRSSTTVTRCTSFASLFRGTRDSAKVRENLRLQSEHASRLFFERSLLIWLHLHRLIREGLPLPDMHKSKLGKFVRLMYTYRTQKSPLKDDALKKTFQQYANVLPDKVGTRPASSNVVTHAANAYAGAMRRHFAHLDTVKRRIRRYASARLFDCVVQPEAGEEDGTGLDAAVLDEVVKRKRDVGDAPLYNICGALEDPEFPVSAMHPDQRTVLKEIRDRLELPEGTPLTDSWLRRNIHSSIRFSLRVVDTLDEVREQAQAVWKHYEQTIKEDDKRPKLRRGATSGLHFVPLNKLDRRFVTLDATDLMGVMGLSGVEESLVADVVREAVQSNITKIFGKDYDPRSGEQAWTFTGTMDTDGQSVHLHFLRPKKKGDKASPTRDDDDDDKDDDGVDLPVGVQDSSPEEVQSPTVEPETALTSMSTEEGGRLAHPPKLIISVDPGRVNLATMTVMVDGKVLMIKGTNGRHRPLKFTFSNRQYYTLRGTRKREVALKGRQRRDDAKEDAEVEGAKDAEQRRLASSGSRRQLRSALSATSLKTGDVSKIVAYMLAHQTTHADANQKVWSEALSKRKSTERWRGRVSKDSTILRWFHQVKAAIKKRTGLEEATVVWGCRVAPSGKGNLSVPTDRIAQLAKRVEGWNVVTGDEFRTSKNSCVPPHVVNLSPRFRGEKTTRRVKRHDRVQSQVRHGFVLGLSAKRVLRRACGGTSSKLRKEPRAIGMRKDGGGAVTAKRSEVCIIWTYDGHSGEMAEVKATKKAERELAGFICRYIRGLRAYQGDDKTKFVDRDVNGSINIGLLWLYDNVVGRFRPVVFVRPKQATVGGSGNANAGPKASTSLPAPNSRFEG